MSLTNIEGAGDQIEPAFTNSPQYHCGPLSKSLGCRVTLKVETQNPVRSFKGRGSQIAVGNAVKNGAHAVVCASAGNLGQAVAYCARSHGIDSVVYVSNQANRLKRERISELGASLRLVDGDIEVARAKAQAFSRTDGVCLIEDSENIATCEGAATIGLELIADGTPALDAVLVSLGGGALATGIGHVMKHKCPSTEVLCVQPQKAPAMTLSWRAKRVVTTETIDTIADGVAGRFPIQAVLDDLLEVADDALLVGEESIRNGMQLLYSPPA
ncbi:MAG: pyridoxal-phosphate dependent enzyme [Planctomycetota bacterium]